MKNTIECFIGLTSEEYDTLCTEATLVFDTNVLLNLYRYSNNTRVLFVSLLSKLSDRVWLPHQVAYEFGRNRSKIIYETVDRYKTIASDAKSFIEKLRNDLRLGTSDTEINDLSSTLESWIANYKSSNLKVTSIEEDKFVLPILLEIFDGKVGEKYDKQKIDTIEEEGKKRYAKEIPPGYKDKTKTNGNEYGDLIIWNQIIDYAKTNSRDIIFVTGDIKEDWWENVHGRTTGPRSELRREFSEQTNRKFHMYSMERFIDIFSSMQGKTVEKDIIEEVRNVSESEFKVFSQNINNNYYTNLVLQLNHINDEIETRRNYINGLFKKYGKMNAMPQNVKEILANTKKHIVVLEHEGEGIRKKMDSYYSATLVV